MKYSLGEKPRKNTLFIQRKLGPSQIKQKNYQMYTRVANILQRSRPKYESKKINYQYHKKNSLNDQFIKKENKKMLERLIKLKPTICKKNIESDWIKNSQYLGKNIHKICQKLSTTIRQNKLQKIQIKQNKTAKTEQSKTLQTQKSCQILQPKKRNHKSFLSEEFLQNNCDDIKKSKEKLLTQPIEHLITKYRLPSILQLPQSHQILLWSGFSIIDSNQIKINIFRFVNNYKILILKNNQNLFLYLNEEQGQNLFNRLEYNYLQFCRRLLFQNGKLFFRMIDETKKQFQVHKNLDQQKQIYLRKTEKSLKTIFALQNQIEELKKYQTIEDQTSNKIKILAINRQKICLKKDWRRISQLNIIK